MPGSASVAVADAARRPINIKERDCAVITIGNNDRALACLLT